MSESAFRVETTHRLAQWRIDALSSCTYRKSDPFRIGIWNWYLTVEKNKQLFVKLYPEASSVTREQPPIASFIIKLISSSSPNRRTLIHPGICDKQLKSNDDFVWAIDTLFTGRIIIDVEFLDLKIVPPSKEAPRMKSTAMMKMTGLEGLPVGLHTTHIATATMKMTGLEVGLCTAQIATMKMTGLEGLPVGLHTTHIATATMKMTGLKCLPVGIHMTHIATATTKMTGLECLPVGLRTTQTATMKLTGLEGLSVGLHMTHIATLKRAQKGPFAAEVTMDDALP